MDAHDRIRSAFPEIKPGFAITSPLDETYNCIAWAAGDNLNWWWPSPVTFWPIHGVSEPTLGAFLDAFETLGFKRCADFDLELDVQKIAIYVGSDGFVTHMARQLPDGFWTSKLGPSWDIRHLSPECLNGNSYGSVSVVVEKRERKESFLSRAKRRLKKFLSRS